MPVWIAATLFVAATGLVSALLFMLVFAAGARVADALRNAFREGGK